MNLLPVRQDTVSPVETFEFIAQCVPFLQKDIVCISVSDRIKFTNVFHYNSWPVNISCGELIPAESPLFTALRSGSPTTKIIKFKEETTTLVEVVGIPITDNYGRVVGGIEIWKKFRP